QLEYRYLPGSAKTVSGLSPMDEHAETALVTNTMAITACLPGHLAILSIISGTNPIHEIPNVSDPLYGRRICRNRGRSFTGIYSTSSRVGSTSLVSACLVERCSVEHKQKPRLRWNSVS